MRITRKFLIREGIEIGIPILLGFTMTATGLVCRQCLNNLKDFWVVSSFTALIWILLWKEMLGLRITSVVKISWIKFPIWRFVVGVASTLIYSFLALKFAVEPLRFCELHL